MVTKDGVGIKRTEGYSCGPSVRFVSGDIQVAVLRTENRKKKKYLVSVFANAEDGHSRYLQFFINKDEARLAIRAMK